MLFVQYIHTNCHLEWIKLVEKKMCKWTLEYKGVSHTTHSAVSFREDISEADLKKYNIRNYSANNKMINLQMYIKMY